MGIIVKSRCPAERQEKYPTHEQPALRDEP